MPDGQGCLSGKNAYLFFNIVVVRGTNFLHASALLTSSSG